MSDLVSCVQQSAASGVCCCLQQGACKASVLEQTSELEVENSELQARKILNDAESFFNVMDDNTDHREDVNLQLLLSSLSAPVHYGLTGGWVQKFKGSYLL